MKHSLLKLLALLALMPLGACGLPQRPANELYVLTAQPPAAHGRALPLTLRIEEPEAAAGLDSDKIAVLDTPNHLTHYNGVAWARPLPALLQGFLVDAFQQSHRFKTVSTEQEQISAQLVLLTDIRDFTVDNATSPPTVTLRLVAKLVRAGDHGVIASFPIKETVTAEANHMPEIIAAFDLAANRAVADVLKAIKKTAVK